MQVELIETPKEITLTSLQNYIAKCSSVVRNKEPKDAARLWDRLLKESYGGKASRVLEYIPCKVLRSELSKEYTFKASFQYFGFFDEDFYYTNARELLNIGLDFNEVIKLVDFSNYKAVRVVAPYFIYGQISTHNQITTVSHSARYTESSLGFWKPKEIGLTNEEWNNKVLNTTPKRLEDYMKSCGVIRREVSARGKDMLQNRIYTLGGWTNNPNSWEHFINQRAKDKHTQLETRELASEIARVIQIN